MIDRYKYMISYNDDSRCNRVIWRLGYGLKTNGCLLFITCFLSINTITGHKKHANNYAGMIFGGGEPFG